jgi:hypothetical protein
MAEGTGISESPSSSGEGFGVRAISGTSGRIGPLDKEFLTGKGCNNKFFIFIPLD